jgi:hypothetical protein
MKVTKKRRKTLKNYHKKNQGKEELDLPLLMMRIGSMKMIIHTQEISILNLMKNNLMNLNHSRKSMVKRLGGFLLMNKEKLFSTDIKKNLVP